MGAASRVWAGTFDVQSMHHMRSMKCTFAAVPHEDPLGPLLFTCIFPVQRAVKKVSVNLQSLHDTTSKSRIKPHKA